MIWKQLTTGRVREIVSLNLDWDANYWHLSPTRDKWSTRPCPYSMRTRSTA
jgi:hypothetical protein